MNSINQYDSNGLKHGFWKISFYNTAEKQYEINFVHGQAQGLLLTFLPYKYLDNYLWSSSFYVDDSAEGESIQYTY
jgi:antitoxin component YwqK of YwqJK toxin-antitoxin module